MKQIIILTFAPVFKIMSNLLVKKELIFMSEEQKDLQAIAAEKEPKKTAPVTTAEADENFGWELMLMML